jgi:hypothetical protein
VKNEDGRDKNLSLSLSSFSFFFLSCPADFRAGRETEGEKEER